MKTIFLDFGGVLHPEFCHESKHFCCLPFFEQVLRDVDDCEVVVTSTWRLHLPLPCGIAFLQTLLPEWWMSQASLGN